MVAFSVVFFSVIYVVLVMKHIQSQTLCFTQPVISYWVNVKRWALVAYFNMRVTKSGGGFEHIVCTVIGFLTLCVNTFWIECHWQELLHMVYVLWEMIRIDLAGYVLVNSRSNLIYYKWPLWMMVMCKASFSLFLGLNDWK